MTEGSESGGSHRKESASLAVLVLFVPGHLDGFELAFVGEFGGAGEAVKLADPSVKIGEADGERVSGWELVGKPNADFFRAVPIERGGHESLLNGVKQGTLNAEAQRAQRKNPN